MIPPDSPAPVPRSPPTDPVPFRLDATLWPSLAALAATVVLFEITPLDLATQDHFYDFSRQAWLVDGQALLPRLLFYSGPKALLVALGVTLLGFILGPSRWRARHKLDRRGLLVAFLTLATGPALVGLGKAITNIYCPNELIRYGGDTPYVRVLECSPAGEMPPRRGHCFPAGHASGGFALFGLIGLRGRRAGRLVGFLAGLGAGSWMGIYQMLKGAHYLSHTLVTAWLIWIVFLLWRRALRVPTDGIPDARSR